LENQRGKMGMTWTVKARRVAFALMIVGTLAMASGADWMELAMRFRLW
jgi:hypothetical protein